MQLSRSLNTGAVKAIIGIGDYSDGFKCAARISASLCDDEFTKTAHGTKIKELVAASKFNEIDEYLASVNEAICKKHGVDSIAIMLHNGTLEIVARRNAGGIDQETAIWCQHGLYWYAF